MKTSIAFVVVLMFATPAVAQCVGGRCYTPQANVAWQTPIPAWQTPSLQPAQSPQANPPRYVGGWPAVSIQGNPGRPMVIRRRGPIGRFWFGNTYIVY